MSASDGTSDGSLLVLVVDTLTGEVSGTSLGDLDDDGRLDVSGSLEDGVDDRRRGDVGGRNSVLEGQKKIVSRKNAGAQKGRKSGMRDGDRRQVMRRQRANGKRGKGGESVNRDEEERTLLARACSKSFLVCSPSRTPAGTTERAPDIVVVWVVDRKKRGRSWLGVRAELVSEGHSGLFSPIADFKLRLPPAVAKRSDVAHLREEGKKKGWLAPEVPAAPLLPSFSSFLPHLAKLTACPAITPRPAPHLFSSSRAPSSQAKLERWPWSSYNRDWAGRVSY